MTISNPTLGAKMPDVELQRRLDIMSDRISGLAGNVAVMAERDRQISEDIEGLSAKVTEMDNKLRRVELAADRWKWSFLLVIGLGSLVGWMLSIWDKLVKVWGH